MKFLNIAQAYAFAKECRRLKPAQDFLEPANPGLTPGATSVRSLAQRGVELRAVRALAWRGALVAALMTALLPAGYAHGSETRATQGAKSHAQETRATQTRAIQPQVAHAMSARKALFEDSQLETARTEAAAALRHNGASVEALFVQMETAAMEADTATLIHAALRLCELRGRVERDPRVTIAAARLLNLAGNTVEFRGAIPKIEKLLGISHPVSPPPPGCARCSGQAPAGEIGVGQPHPQAHYLRAALLAAAADGAPGIAMQQVAREAGLLTEWRVAGPFGRFPNLDFDRPWAPEQDALQQPASDGHQVERVRFEDGSFRLPEYFSQRGVLYAASQTASAGVSRWVLRLESPGTLDVFVDGARVLRKDARFRATPATAWRALRLRPGKHQVVVKFLASALPFRVELLPSRATSADPMLGAQQTIAYAPEAQYVEAARKYWEGDYQGTIAGLKGASSAAASFLLFQTWSRLGDDAPEAGVMLNAAVKAAPDSLASQYELAARAYAADRTEEALSRLQPVLAARPNFVPAQQLLADLAIRMHWPAEAAKALEIRVRLHPSCEAIRQTQRFLASHARYEQAEELDKSLETCAPDSIAYVHSLSEAGRHEQASAAAQKAVQARPLDRAARELLVRELALAGEGERALEAARELATLAPNSQRYQRMARAAAANPDELLDNTRGGELARKEPFYSPYRREGVQMVRQTAERRFSGGPAVMLVNDRVAQLEADGKVSLYVHKLTRVLDRDGIERYGEVELPGGAEVLELRTIKADGAVVEPEFHRRKATISMPALAPGDVIEQEYVQRFRDGGGVAAHADVFRHSFGSTGAPILYSRFVAITPAGDEDTRVVTTGEVPLARTEGAAFDPGSRVEGPRRTSSLTRVWEKNDIAQSIEEVASARGDILPTVRLQPLLRDGWREVRDTQRERLIEATRAGARVEQMAARVRTQPPQARARTIYRLVVNSVRSTGSGLEDLSTAEDTLASHAGSRTAALLAVARAAGLDADLVLARNVGTITGSYCRIAEQRNCGIDKPAPGLDAYTQPLVRFRFDDGHGRVSETVVDAETDGLAFGALPPGVARKDALLVNWPEESQVAESVRLRNGCIPAGEGDRRSSVLGSGQCSPGEAPGPTTIYQNSYAAGTPGPANAYGSAAGTEGPPIIALPSTGVSDQSTATAEVTLDGEGNLSAQITIVLGAWRAAQMRSILAGLEPGQQPHFFQQMAARIFAGAEDVSGETRNEQDPEQALVVVLHCRAPRFANLAQGAADIDQLVPALGLKRMYVGGGARKFPLYIDTPLFETAAFRLHLPPGMTALRPPDGVELRNDFGSYSLRFRQISPEDLEITRSFRIAVQVIPPERYGQFASFAAKIEDAERQRITVQSTELRLQASGFGAK